MVKITSTVNGETHTVAKVSRIRQAEAMINKLKRAFSDATYDWMFCDKDEEM